MDNYVTKRCNKPQIASLRNLLLLVTVTAITGCSSLPETITGTGNTHVGYRSYDPCIRCGESWQVLPNEYMNALKTKKRWDAERAGQKVSNSIDVEGPVEQPKVIIIE